MKGREQHRSRLTDSSPSGPKRSKAVADGDDGGSKMQLKQRNNAARQASIDSDEYFLPLLVVVSTANFLERTWNLRDRRSLALLPSSANDPSAVSAVRGRPASFRSFCLHLASLPDLQALLHRPQPPFLRTQVLLLQLTTKALLKS